MNLLMERQRPKLEIAVSQMFSDGSMLLITDEEGEVLCLGPNTWRQVVDTAPRSEAHVNPPAYSHFAGAPVLMLDKDVENRRRIFARVSDTITRPA